MPVRRTPRRKVTNLFELVVLVGCSIVISGLKYSIPKSQVVAALEAEREAKELYQSKLEESLRSDDTDDDISDIPTKIIGSPHRVRIINLCCCVLTTSNWTIFSTRLIDRELHVNLLNFR